LSFGLGSALRWAAGTVGALRLAITGRSLALGIGALGTATTLLLLDARCRLDVGGNIADELDECWRRCGH
jgi:hypothetical protein